MTTAADKVAAFVQQSVARAMAQAAGDVAKVEAKVAGIGSKLDEMAEDAVLRATRNSKENLDAALQRAEAAFANLEEQIAKNAEAIGSFDGLVADEPVSVPALPAPTASPVQIVTFEHLSELREELTALTDRVDRIARVRESGVDDATARRFDQQSASIDDLYSRVDQLVANRDEEHEDIAQAGEFNPLRARLVGAADPDTRARIEFLERGHVFVAAAVSAIERELAVLRAGLEPELASEMSQESDRVYQEELRNNAAEVGIPIKEKEGGDESI